MSRAHRQASVTEPMSVALITGSGGLIGSEAARGFAREGLAVVGVDNDMRGQYFGAHASTAPNVARLHDALGSDYTHYDIDVRDRDAILDLFKRYRAEISVVVHAAAQPSHDWSARAAFTDFDVNAVGTLNVLESARQHCSEAPFIFCSTNKVYGDAVNALPFEELDERYELPDTHDYVDGIREDFQIDASLHSPFGVAKLAADILVQEYGRYFGMNTVCFRGGTLTGPSHAAAELHGFLAYVVRAAMEHRRYTIFGYKGKQVRDAIHARDVVAAFIAFFHRPRPASVYNLGGGRTSNASVAEALTIAQEITGTEIEIEYREESRIGDHIWWISSNRKFIDDFPEWEVTYDIPSIIRDIYETNVENWVAR
jgi:CDP-paratose 2-epimerase